MSSRLRSIESGIVAGFIAGVVAFAGARVAMRLLAVGGGASLFFPSLVFTFDGTFGVLIVGGLNGIVPGLAFVALRRWLPRSPGQAGLTYGLVLLFSLGIPFLIADPEFHVNPDNAGLGRLLFTPLFAVYGLALALVAMRLERQLTDAYRAGSWSAALFGAAFLAAVPYAFFTDMKPLTRPDPPLGIANAIRGVVFLAIGTVLLVARTRLGHGRSRIWSAIPLGVTALLAVLGALALLVQVGGTLHGFDFESSLAPILLSWMAAALMLGVARQARGRIARASPTN